ncbi:uncharacterized protein KY384_004095 [Bacidia gigantensis]|uniref:uncharacterized protein n=1 Tax=Bacidia gigantensis TaxID=2732470 RepID=UPI001D03CEA3|nr:uncharacterized protein KY384_004095 [Bacidia gigantensis]KAG8530738.1 hypothetical protein KY384_004095 [Bacidia gigantensis]
MNGRGLDFEIQFALTCLAYTHTLLARSSLLTLYASTSPSVDERVKIVQSATKHFLATNSIHVWLATCAMEIDASQAVIETLSQTQSALAALAMAEATLLAVLKDDPYPFVIAQSRDKNDKDWMIKAPEIPKVRAHLFARLCLSAYEHAGRAEAGLSGSGRVGTDVLEYLKDLRKTALAKAGRFFGIDAELAGETGKGIAWLKGAKAQLGFKDEGHEETTAFAKLRGLSKNIREKREDRKIEKGGQLGGAAGRLEELGVLGHLQTKWVKMNDTVCSMNTQLIPPFEPLLANMPSGRDIHSSQPFVKPTLDEETLSRLRAPPERAGLLDDGQDIESSDDDDDRAKHSADIPGTFPGGSTQSTEPYY